MNIKKKIITTSIALASVLTLSACVGTPEASSRGTDDPIEVVKIVTEAAEKEDWGTVCAYMREKEAMYIATYWIRSDDTCADNFKSVTYDASQANQRILDHVGGEIHWDTAWVEPRENSAIVNYRFTPAGGGEIEESWLRVNDIPGHGYQWR